MAGRKPPRLSGDRYQIGEFRHVGRLTETWDGWDTRLDRAVTIHLVREDLNSDRELLERLIVRLREAARVDHSGFARVYDVIGDDTIGVVVEHTSPNDLRAQTGAGHTLQPTAAIEVADKLATSIDAIHSLGITHGGLTLSGVSTTDDGRLVINDLGTGGASDASGDETIRGDITSLASMVHELVVGRPPHSGLGSPELDPSLPASFAGPLDDALHHGRFSDATTFVSALRTTRHEVSAPASFSSTERRWLLPAAFVLLIAAVLILVGSVLGRTEAGRTIIEGAREVVGFEPSPTTVATTTTSTTSSTAVSPIVEPIAVSRVTDFDPSGDGTESPNRLTLINDGDPTRGWQTERYNSRRFGNLKDGVGLVIEISDTAELESIVIRSPTRNWAFELYASSEPPLAVVDWGEPIFAVVDVQADVEISDVAGLRTPASLLLWITDLGQGPEFRVIVTDIAVTGTRN